MLQATTELARRIDRAEIDFCALAGSAGERAVDSISAAGGRGLFSAPGSPLNKVLGLGLGAPVSDADLDAIEAFYVGHASPVQIELCPLVVPDVPPRLSKRGYVVQGFENQLARRVPASPLEGLDRYDAPRVETATPAESDLWLDVIARGFAAAEAALPDAAIDPDAVTAVRAMMRGFAHPSISKYLAWIDRQPAGGGASWIYDRIVGIAGTATVPAFRRRGVQTVVTARGVDDAIGRADIATASVAPGSMSQRTFERLGFQVLYTRTIFVKAADERR